LCIVSVIEEESLACLVGGGNRKRAGGDEERPYRRHCRTEKEIVNSRGKGEGRKKESKEVQPPLRPETGGAGRKTLEKSVLKGGERTKKGLKPGFMRGARNIIEKGLEGMKDKGKSETQWVKGEEERVVRLNPQGKVLYRK